MVVLRYPRGKERLPAFGGADVLARFRASGSSEEERPFASVETVEVEVEDGAGPLA